ncbi:hypothetical protein OESDEN_22897 [Oesophagostomum dentatum]|uniref:Uncharacterized protein n=1 Tax=Oesophagostomum dentatum TaxID=61180 RepID=A0A0B1RWM7_OESDE|nr:hypothetical protein OESDEN_22897 [Oesophagostomum dentatum]
MRSSTSRDVGRRRFRPSRAGEGKRQSVCTKGDEQEACGGDEAGKACNVREENPALLGIAVHSKVSIIAWIFL